MNRTGGISGIESLTVTSGSTVGNNSEDRSSIKQPITGIKPLRSANIGYDFIESLIEMDLNLKRS